MVLPNKVIKPIDSLVGVSAVIHKILGSDKEMDINNLYKRLNEQYPVRVSVEKYILSLDLLFLLGIIDVDDEVIVKR